METQLDLNFCNLIYSDDDENLNFEKDCLIKAYTLNKKFMKIDIPKFDVRIVDSREKFEEIWGDETPDYVSAFAKNDNIVIFAYDLFEKETRWEKEKFEGTLIHEINHLFYQELRNDEYDPLWMSEGLATFMQHDKKKFDYENKVIMTKEEMMVDYENMGLESYQIFTMFVEYLVLEFGEEKILLFIEELKEGEKLNNIFQKIYMKSFSELIENGNRYHKIA